MHVTRVRVNWSAKLGVRAIPVACQYTKTTARSVTRRYTAYAAIAEEFRMRSCPTQLESCTPASLDSLQTASHSYRICRIRKKLYVLMSTRHRDDCVDDCVVADVTMLRKTRDHATVSLQRAELTFWTNWCAHNYSCKRGTACWTVAFFFNLIDIAA